MICCQRRYSADMQRKYATSIGPPRAPPHLGGEQMEEVIKVTMDMGE
jgi:hypothetical protein